MTVPITGRAVPVVGDRRGSWSAPSAWTSGRIGDGGRRERQRALSSEHRNRGHTGHGPRAVRSRPACAVANRIAGVAKRSSRHAESAWFCARINNNQTCPLQATALRIAASARHKSCPSWLSLRERYFAGSEYPGADRPQKSSTLVMR
jgi:hypothetical protein